MTFNPDSVYKKTGFLPIVREGNSVAVWHSLFGYSRIISPETLGFLEEFSSPKTLRSVIGDQVTTETESALDDLISCYFLIPDNFDDRAFIRRRMQQRDNEITSGLLINHLELIMSEACNFRCTYCIHFNNLEISDRINSSNKFMRFDLSRRTVDWYLGILRQHGKRTAEINFGGGEPLLAWKVAQQVLEYCSGAYGMEFKFSFSINTNASLITPEIASVLKKYRVRISSSMDGLLEGNDKVRLTKSGDGTFSQIIRGFEVLSLAGYPINGIAVTVTEGNFYELNESIIDWALGQDMTNVRIDIDVVGMVEVPVDRIIEKLMKIRRYAMSKGIDVPGFWSRPAENLGGSTLDERVAFCGAVRGNSICVSPSGDIYGCGYSTNKLGEISESQSFHNHDSIYHSLVKDHLTGMTKMCEGCMIEGQCGGGCMITQEFSKAGEAVKIKRMCEFYRRMTQEIIRDQLREIAT